MRPETGWKRILGLATLTTLATLASGALGSGAADASEAKAPNIVFIMADDCTYRDLGCYGGQAHTPHIDKLATEGMRFTRCFQAAPMCSPTRHNIYTGLYPVKSGAYPNHTFVKEGTRSVVHYLKPLGYRVALSGKRHIAPAEAFPFEYSNKGGNPDIATIGTLLAECAESGTPFCLFACSNEPHSPWDKGDSTRYKPAALDLPPHFVDTEATRESYSKYLAEVTYFDGQVGDIVALLDKHGLRENTLVIVVSEQGSSFPFAKWTLYDTGIQSACIARWPGVVKAGTVAEAMIEYVDMLPTFVEAAGGRPDLVLDGRSFLPVLKGDAIGHKEHVFALMTTRGIINGSDHFGIRSVRTVQYKYIRNLTPAVEFKNAATKSPEFLSWVAKSEGGDADAAEKVRRYRNRPAVELYDITKDPYEWDNLAENPDYASVLGEMAAELAMWMESQGDLGAETEMAAMERQGSRRKGIQRPQAGRDERRMQPKGGEANQR